MECPEGDVERIELPAGPQQRIVLYVTDDNASQVDPAYAWAYIARDAESQAVDGWEIVSTGVMPLRQMGTAGNIFFQSGGQFVTQAAISVVYAKR